MNQVDETLPPVLLDVFFVSFKLNHCFHIQNMFRLDYCLMFIMVCEVYSLLISFVRVLL